MYTNSTMSARTTTSANISPEVLRRIVSLLGTAGLLATLTVTPSLNFDGVLVGKLLATSTVAFALLAILLSQRSKLKIIPPKVLVLVLVFLGWALIVLFFSGSSLNQQLWGVFGRNNGFLTYFCLSVFLLVGSIIQDLRSSARIIGYFFVTSLITTLYCILQILGLDPVRWSEMRTFATFGNVNFLSAFLGMSSLLTVSYFCLDSKKNKIVRLACLLLVILELSIVISTGSIQGILTFAFGLSVILYLKLRSMAFWQKWMNLVYGLMSFVGFSLVVFSLFNKGPFAKFIFQTSIILRTDYMHAGWAMLLKKPIFGVGIDSYGDWYRQLRGSISTLRGNPDRIANTAHNIFLDLGASGGFPLLTAYVILLSIAFLSAVKVFRGARAYNPVLTTIFAVWAGYLVQGLVSINHLSLSVWGWIFTGLMIGMKENSSSSSQHESTFSPDKIRRGTRKKVTKAIVPVGVAFSSLVGAVIGFLIALPPLTADAEFRRANLQNQQELLRSASLRLGATAFHREMVVENAIRSNMPEVASQLAYELVKDYPRDFYAWRIIALTSPPGTLQRKIAVDKLRFLDPFNNQLPAH